MEIQVEALFTHDENGRLQYVNEPERSPAPRFFLGRTKKGSIWRFRYDLPEDVVSKLDDLLSSEPIPTNLLENPINFEAFKNVLQAHTEIQQVWMGPAYRFPDDIRCPTNAVRVTKENAELLRFGFTDYDSWVRVESALYSCSREWKSSVFLLQCTHFPTGRRGRG